MKFKIDHDYHIHSKLSLCSQDEKQTAENILKYAEDNGLSEICITDHFWDIEAGWPSPWYAEQDFEHISEILPLHQGENIRFYFGCESEMDRYYNIGINDKNADKFDFIIVPTTHLHMNEFTIFEADRSNERRAYLYLERLRKLMESDLPFEKVGIAHLTCPLLAPKTWEDHLAVLDMISDAEYKEVYSKIAEKGAGFELNFTPADYTAEDLERVIRPYKIAKEVGCKFYLGSDAHIPKDFTTAMTRFNDMVNLLSLEGKDRFRFK